MGDSTDSFVCELKMGTNRYQEKVLDKRLNAARYLYNAVLSEALKRISLMRQSRIYQGARKMPAGRKRTQAFNEARKRYNFSEYELHRYAIKTKNSCWIGDHLDAHTCQKLATRAYQAANEYCLGKRGRPRFKSFTRGLHSVEGKSNDTGIRYRDGDVLWKGLKIPCLIDRGDPVVTHGLSSRIKYTRIVRRKIRGRWRYYAQLVCEGKSHLKEKNKPEKKGDVGLDVNVSGVAAVSGSEAALIEFAPGIKDKKRVIRRLKRKLDRQRRANNPDNFNLDGTVKKGAKSWKESDSYLETKEKIAELKRKEAGQRKTENNRTVNEVLKMGDSFKIEKTAKS